MSQVITINFAQGQTEAVADQPLTQWAYGQKLKFVGLELPAAYAVDFSNWEFQGDSIQRIGNADGVAVPTEILTSGRNVYAFIWITDANSGRRRYMAMARVIPGPDPDPEEPNPQESSEISEALAELNAAVETAEDAAGRGPQIRDGYWYTWSAESQEYENTEVPSTGNKIWWTTSEVYPIPGGVRYTVLLPGLNGPAGASPAVSDLVVGPAPITSGSATYLYYIYGIDTTLQQVILKGIGSIKGAQGDPGAAGVSPSVSVSEITGGHQVSITDAQGTETFDVMDGEEGPAGPSGGQFWTAQGSYSSPSYTWSFADLIGPVGGTPAIGDLVYYSTYRYTITSIDAENQTVTCTIRASIRGLQGPAGQGVPVGGDQAQILSKKSATDYDTQWSDLIALLPSTFKAALLQLAQKVAYINDQGQTYYQDLYDALYPPKELVSISAVFTQGQTVVYDTASLDSLKTMLVVTGTYDDQSTETIPSTGYTLSGTLTAGTSTITVTCDGKTTTFTVQVTHQPGVYAVTNNLTGCVNSNSANSVTEGGSYSGTITASSGYTLTGATVSITMGGTDITGTSYSNGTISIASVTGALVITVTAVAVVLSSISAVYTQGGTVYDTDTLDSLKADLVVTAVYSDSSTQTVPAADYTLSGTLTAGTSTITVSYGGKTDTFNVSVTHIDNLLFHVADRAFDGTAGDGIATGINIQASDSSFTILAILTTSGAMSGTGTKFMLFASRNSTPNIQFTEYNNNAAHCNFRYMAKYSDNAFDIRSAGVYKIAVVHTAGSNSSTCYMKANSGNVLTKTLNSSPFTTDPDAEFYFGSPNNGYWYLNGTLTLGEIYSKAFSSAEIDAFMSGG